MRRWGLIETDDCNPQRTFIVPAQSKWRAIRLVERAYGAKIWAAWEVVWNSKTGIHEAKGEKV